MDFFNDRIKSAIRKEDDPTLPGFSFEEMQAGIYSKMDQITKEQEKKKSRKVVWWFFAFGLLTGAALVYWNSGLQSTVQPPNDGNELSIQPKQNYATLDNMPTPTANEKAASSAEVEAASIQNKILQSNQAHQSIGTSSHKSYNITKKYEQAKVNEKAIEKIGKRVIENNTPFESTSEGFVSPVSNHPSNAPAHKEAIGDFGNQPVNSEASHTGKRFFLEMPANVAALNLQLVNSESKIGIGHLSMIRPQQAIKKQNDFALIMMGGANIGIGTLPQKYNTQKGFTASEGYEWGPTLSMVGQKNLAGNFKLILGLQYSQLNTRLDYHSIKDTSILREDVVVKEIHNALTGHITEVYGDTIIGATAYKDVIKYNNSTSYSVILGACYDIGVGRSWSIQPQAALSYNLSTRHQGLTYKSDGSLISRDASIIGEGNQSLPLLKKKTGLSLVLGTGIAVGVNRTLKLMTNVAYNLGLNNHSNEVGVIRKPSFFTLSTGVIKYF